MRSSLSFAIGLVALLFSLNLHAEGGSLPQKVLYVGHRGGEYEPLLKKHFTKVEVVQREKFKPGLAKDFDVVMLDWPQSGFAREERISDAPLGRREEWSKPTVLLGSAGLNLAVAWKLKGGAGCTCLGPVAYGLKEHPIFKTPIAIDVKATTNIATPRTFSYEVKEPMVDVLPLVDGIKNFATVVRDYNRGWCTYYKEFADVPEVEFFCGGINDKTPTASALWRQGNLLHFGFEQSPEEMNATGRGMLVNAVVYISKFSEDRPIDVTPSVFGKEKVAILRRLVKGALTSEKYSRLTKELRGATLASFNYRDLEATKQWLEENASWLHPGPSNLLEVDMEAKELGVAFDSEEFLSKSIASLKEEKTKDAAVIVLARYFPEGPGVNADAATWEKWAKENSPYLFYSEMGCYRWYIDPLAKKRGVPTKELRGLARADVR